MDKFFLGQVKQTNGNLEKGIVIKNSLDEAKQGYHAYLGAYAYGNDKDKSDGHIKTDYVMVQITDGKGLTLQSEAWELQSAPQPESE